MAGLYTSPLGTTSASRTPRERAFRLMYLQANRNRYNDPQRLAEVATAAENAGVDISGSLTSESTDYSRRAATEEAAQTAQVLNLRQFSEQDKIRREMLAAAGAGLPLAAYRRRAIAAGARPSNFDLAAAQWQTKFAPKPDQMATTAAGAGASSVPFNPLPGTKTNPMKVPFETVFNTPSF